MAKSALSGEMNTKITIKKLVRGVDAQGFETKSWEPIFNSPAWCKWVNAHGSEVYDNMRLDLKEVATITMRYTPLVDVRCRVWKYPDNVDDDQYAYEIISMDHVESSRAFLEIKLRRVVTA